MPESAPTDEQLMLQAKDDAPDAFNELVSRYQHDLVNFFGHSGVYGVADDLAQETFIRLYKYRKRYKQRAKLRTFLYLLARQVRIDHLRKIQRKSRLIEEARLRRDIAASETDSVCQRYADVEDALRRLPDEMRDVVVMSQLQGLRYAEIANVLGIPEGTVKSRMFNALRRLRKVSLIRVITTTAYLSSRKARSA